MALASSSTRILYDAPNRYPYTHTPLHRPFLNPSSPRTVTFTVSANPKKQFSSSSSRGGKFDSKNRKSGSVTTKEQEEIVEEKGTAEIESFAVDDGFVIPELPGDKPDFFEGPQWDALGFFVQYMWAFGIVFALVSSGIAVATYNEGATDFKETPVYKEAIQSQDLLEEPDTPNSDVFESNPTEQAPNLE
ncbi:hypothetical protein ACJIZ3_020809 [Penstemon smallii]|uniref:Uncharacterized protein n=1 Tax=Penstemon smallii TaxID=265156 RepID=A0ABD3SJN2_9LAMI